MSGPSGRHPDTTQTCAMKALEKISALNLKPIPQIYELWFRYYQGDPEVVQAIDRHMGRLDEVACHKIYNRYLSENARNDAVKTISEQMQQAIAEMVGMLHSVKNSQSEYGETLTDVTDRIKKADSMDDLEHVVSSIVKDTKRMLQKNQELELQLVNSSQQVSELKENLDNVRREAMTDGLTGLSNRKAFDKQVRDCVEDAVTTGNSLVLMIFDIDHFKKFNDSFGHQVGDQVLRLVARTLTDGIKGRDIAARYGGEEFVILLPDTPLISGVKVAESLRKNVEGKEVVNRMSHQTLGQITLSVGVAEYIPGENVTEFIARADAALYQAKNDGRNRVCVAET